LRRLLLGHNLGFEVNERRAALPCVAHEVKRITHVSVLAFGASGETLRVAQDTKNPKTRQKTFTNRPLYV
jgi:hypothetical protein